jgi:phage terminase large subunit-like protein
MISKKNKRCQNERNLIQYIWLNSNPKYQYAFLIINPSEITQKYDRYTFIYKNSPVKSTNECTINWIWNIEENILKIYFMKVQRKTGSFNNTIETIILISNSVYDIFSEKIMEN